MADVHIEWARLGAPRGGAGRRSAALIAAFLALLLLSLAPAGGAAQEAGGDRSAATQRLFEAVLDNDLDAVKAALAEGADTRARDSQGRMPAGLAVDKGYFEIAHYILSARKTQRDKERLAAAPPPLPPAPGVTRQAPAEGAAAAGWAVKRTEMAEQPGAAAGGAEMAQTESAERPGQRDAGSTAGSTEIAERAGDSAGAPKAGPAEAAQQTDDDESGWKVKNVEIAGDTGAGDRGDMVEAAAPPARSVETAEPPRPLTAAGIEPPDRGPARTPGGLTPPAREPGDSGAAPEAPAPRLAASQETARAESPAASAPGAAADAGADKPLEFSSLLRSFGELIGVVRPRPAPRQATASREPAGRATATGTGDAPEPVPTAPAPATAIEETATAMAPDRAPSAPGLPEGSAIAGASTETAAPPDPTLPGLAPTERSASAPEPAPTVPEPIATTGQTATASAPDRAAATPGAPGGNGTGRSATETAALPEPTVRGPAPAPGGAPRGELAASPEPGRATAEGTGSPARPEDPAQTAAVAQSRPAATEEPGAVNRLMQNLTKLFQGEEAAPARPDPAFGEETAKPVETAETPQEALPAGSAPRPGETAASAPPGEAVARPQPLPSATSEATEQTLARESAEPRPRPPVPGRDAAPTRSEPPGQALAEVTPAEPDDPGAVISLLEDLAEFFGIRAPRPARPEGPALAENRESAEPRGRAAQPSSAEPPPAIIETAEAPRPDPARGSGAAGGGEQPRPEALPAPEGAASGRDRQLATDPGEAPAEADLAQLAEEPGLSEEAQPLDETSMPTAPPEETEIVDESMALGEPNKAATAEEGGIAGKEAEPQDSETFAIPEEVAKEEAEAGALEAIADAQEVEKLTAAKPPAEETAEAADKKEEQESGWAVRNVVIANLPPGAPGAARRPLPPDSYLGGVVLALGESVRLGKERLRPEEKQTAAAETVQTDATEDAWETPPEEKEGSAEEEAVAAPEDESADDTWAIDDDEDDWGDEEEETQTAADEPVKIRCVEKNQGTTAFCVEPVDWPEELDGQFAVGTVMYQGSKSIVRYDNGKATYIQTFFLTDAFETITDYYKKRYGPPTEVAKRQIAPFASPRLPNPAMLWHAVSPGDNLITTLEIRKYDDVHGGFPDTRRGAVMLYHNWSSPIFPQLSNIELMMAK